MIWPQSGVKRYLDQYDNIDIDHWGIYVVPGLDDF